MSWHHGNPSKNTNLGMWYCDGLEVDSCTDKMYSTKAEAQIYKDNNQWHERHWGSSYYCNGELEKVVDCDWNLGPFGQYGDCDTLGWRLTRGIECDPRRRK
jgi:hypothetical protein